MATTPPGHAIGVDIGGSGIKGAPVDLAAGAFTAERIRVLTPHPATPDAVAGVVKEIVTQLDAPGTIGLTLPSVVLDGVVRTAANIDDDWIGTDAEALFREATGRPVGVVNDADAAGIAEVRFGAGKDRHGVVLLVTLGTGIGSALFIDGTLVPNTELGHLPLHHGDAEDWAADSVRGGDDLSWKEWGQRLSDYMELVEKLFWPNLIIIGGGVSRKSDKFLPHVRARTEIVPAQLLNDAGIIGAALFAPTA
jgi:polyphosphate glucokinase